MHPGTVGYHIDIISASLMLVLGIFAITALHGECPAPGHCCCCDGDCLYRDCPPCPCPIPPPGSSQPTCSLQVMKDRFARTYSTQAAVLAPHPDAVPDKTQLINSTGRHFEWSLGDGWRSGFFPGVLWQLANATDDKQRGLFASAAALFTAGREHKKGVTSTHDVGFMIFNVSAPSAEGSRARDPTPAPPDASAALRWRTPHAVAQSFGAGLLLDGTNQSYRSVVRTAAHSLAARYNSKVGMTRSWGDISDTSQARSWGDVGRYGEIWGDHGETSPTPPRRARQRERRERPHRGGRECPPCDGRKPPPLSIRGVTAMQLPLSVRGVTAM